MLTRDTTVLAELLEYIWCWNVTITIIIIVMLLIQIATRYVPSYTPKQDKIATQHTVIKYLSSNLLLHHEQVWDSNSCS